MKIKYIPKYLSPKHSFVSMGLDLIALDGNSEDLLDFTSQFVYEFEIPQEYSFIQRAFRDESTAELHLVVIQGYTKNEKHIWENPNYYAGGGYRGSRFEDIV